MCQAPQLSEKLLGKHESALTRVAPSLSRGRHRQRAASLGALSDEPGRGNETDDDPHLVPRDFRWNSGDLLASSGGGRAWVGRDQISATPRANTRAAEAAVKAGDFLRRRGDSRQAIG